MILTGPEILKRVERGEIEIDPFDPKRINQASYDICLGPQLLFYRGKRLDARKQNEAAAVNIGPEGKVINPGRLYLGHTVERIHTRTLVPGLVGKSSIGRLGVVVHVTAGHIEPGFNGQITLEIAALGPPVRLYAGMRIGQITFQEVVGEVEDYTARGHYVGEHARGAVASMSWKQFEDD